MSFIVDVKEKILCRKIYELLSPSVYNPTPVRLLNRAKRYQQSDNIKIYAYSEDGEHKGIIAFEYKDNIATILDIAVRPEHQGKGIGNRLIDFIFNKFEIDIIIAETDNDAIGFYKKCGFTVADTKIDRDTKRYMCIKQLNIYEV